jgi:hypothetical protein
MALVFISHAHGDEALARRIVTFLRDALSLESDDFFVSSQAGRGVAPAASIREEILKKLSAAPTLIVLVTPKSAGSPWVWLEAGNRLGSPDKSNPLFAVPSERFLRLLQPVADLRGVCLDNDGDLHELVKAVGHSVGRPPQSGLAYSSALRDLTRAAKSEYSPFGERRMQAVAWLRAHAAALAIAGLLVVVAAFSAWQRIQQLQDELGSAWQRIQQSQDELGEILAGANQTVNEEVARTAARYLLLKGVVVSGQTPIPRATVMATLNENLGADETCEEPECTERVTTSEGEFLLDLTRIQARNGDHILLTVKAPPGFEDFSKQVRVDVRAMDVSVPAQTVALRPAR